jgi:teichuronic acid biosynthesis glycosyltransferase TuaC
LIENVENANPAKLHVLTLTPFYPCDGDEVSGCFVADSIHTLNRFGVNSCVIAVQSIYHAAKRASDLHPSRWVRSPQLPGNFGLASAGYGLAGILLSNVTQLHRRLPVSLIHAHSALPCGHAAHLLSRRLGIPYVVTVHGLDVFNHVFENGIAADWRHNASTRVYQSASKIVCVSNKVRDTLTHAGFSAARAQVVYNGTDPNLFSPAEPPTVQGKQSSHSLLIVGNLLAGKGHELLFRAVAALKNSHSNLQCTVIGEGADHERFVALTHALGIHDRIHFLGQRSRAQVAEAMRECTIFVLPSRYESLGCVYLEAMACGKPAIGCWGQGIDEIIRHGSNGWMIPVDGLEELVTGLRILLADSDLRARIGHAARKTILDSHTLEHQGQELISMYEEVSR